MLTPTLTSGNDLYFRHTVFNVYGPCINICGTCNLLPDLCLHQSYCLWTLVALQVALLQEAEWHEEDSCSLDSTHGEIEIWIVTCTKKIYHYSFLSSDLEMALNNDNNYMQIDRTSVIYKCTKFLHSKSNMHKHASHEFIHQSYTYTWKSEEIFCPKNMYNYGQVQLNQNMITGDNWLIIIILFCTLIQRWKQI